MKALAILLSLSMSANAADLIVNGDFEEPIVAHPNGWTTYYGQNGDGLCEVECYGLIPGWNVWWADTFTPGRVEIQRDFLAGALPFSGRQKAELDSHHRQDSDYNNVVIFQFLEVCPGNPYKLEYAWKSRTDDKFDSLMYILIDELIVANHSMNNAWMYESVNFVASSDLIFAAFVSFGTPTTLGMYVDAISLEGNPECETPANLCEDGRPQSMTLLYNGLNGSDNDQTEYRVTPETVVFPNPAYIKFYDDNGNKKRELLGATTVTIGGLFTLDAVKKIPPKTSFEIIDPATNEIVQTVYFHTSCSQPLAAGDKFGGITVWE